MTRNRHDEPTQPVRVGPTAQEAARYFYEKYWQYAARHGVKPAGGKSPAQWLDTPRNNRDLLIETFRAVLQWLRTGRR